MISPSKPTRNSLEVAINSSKGTRWGPLSLLQSQSWQALRNCCRCQIISPGWRNWRQIPTVFCFLFKVSLPRQGRTAWVNQLCPYCPTETYMKEFGISQPNNPSHSTPQSQNAKVYKIQAGSHLVSDNLTEVSQFPELHRCHLSSISQQCQSKTQPLPSNNSKYRRPARRTWRWYSVRIGG